MSRRGVKSIKKGFYLLFSLIFVTFVHKEILLTLLRVTLKANMKKIILSAASVLSASPVGDVKVESSVPRNAEEGQVWQDVLDRYGNPDVVVVVDASRGNEPDGAVLVYDAGGMDGGGFFVYDGMVVSKKSVADVRSIMQHCLMWLMLIMLLSRQRMRKRRKSISMPEMM